MSQILAKATMMPMPLRTWKSGIGEFEEVMRELENSSHALFETINEFRSYSEPGDFRGLHFQQGLSAISRCEFRLSVAKRKLKDFAGHNLFDKTSWLIDCSIVREYLALERTSEASRGS
jgi:exonuclease VII small subunit